MPRLLGVAPVLLVRDLLASVEFWREKVGFEADNVYGDPPNFAMPSRDQVTIMIAQVPAGKEPPVPNWRVADKTNQAYIWVEEVDKLYAEIIERGAPIDYTIYNTPWGTREFGIQDLDDHDITFGQIMR